MKRRQLTFFALMGISFILLSSCATVDSVTKTVLPSGSVEGPVTFYVGLDGLKMFSEPRFSKNFVATLPLHEEVARDKLEKGFAHIKVVRTGQTGWVNNAHLVWKKPIPAKTIPQESAAPPSEPVSQKSLPEKASEKSVIQAPSEPNPEVEGRDAAIFDRF